ncbi:MAG: nuclear transport factor 2 family protein [Solirubrobacterales bacterium]
MYKLIVKRIVRRAFRRLSEGDYEPVVRQFGPQSRFVFSGDHPLGGERRGRQAVRKWFEEMLRRFPGIRIEPQDVVVNGWPWNTVVAAHLAISATLGDGRPYRNEGMQLLRLRWGRVVEDLIFEDTLKLDAELKRMDRGRRGEPVGVR